MAYNEIDTDIILDLISRKEFSVYTPQTETDSSLNKIIPKFRLDRLLRENTMIEMTSYGSFIKNYMNSYTPYKRLLLKWSTGIGKTIGSLGIAFNFIKHMKMRESIGDGVSGSVYIVGFSSNVFKQELLEFPQFGFVTRKERAHLNELLSVALHDSSKIKAYIDELASKKKRLTNRQGYGYFKFMGYKTFFNRMIRIKDNPGTVDVSRIPSNQLQNMYDEGKISFNQEMLDSIKNSLLIFDEIHNTYNATTSNNWGISVKMTLDKSPEARVLFLSATPIMHSPAEIIDLMNMLISDRKKDFDKADFFEDYVVPKQGAIERIANLTKGYISFIRDTNPMMYASINFVGTAIPNVDFVKFVRCPMTPIHYKTYQSITAEGSITQDSYGILDMVIPAPDNHKLAGLFRMADITKAGSWLSKIKLTVSKGRLKGEILKESNLKHLSSKYHTMLKELSRIMKEKRGKVFIYHNMVHMFGVLLISEILLENGYIHAGEKPSGETLCMKCSRIFAKHDDSHEFVPARFISVHGDLDRTVMENNLSKFNAPENTYGEHIFIVIGSKIIKESYNMKAIRNIMVMSRPDNIPTLIQILGRGRRKNAHGYLKPNERNIDILLFVSSIPGLEGLSYEEIKYKEKINHYKIIQQLELAMHESAIDSPINYDSIFRSSDKDLFDIIEYKKPASVPKKLKLSTFNAYGVDIEVNQIIIVIKKMFIDYSTVWKYSDLLTEIKKSNISHYNMSMIDEHSFIIALSKLIWLPQTNQDEDEYINVMSFLRKSESIYDSLFDSTQRLIYLPSNNFGHVIVPIGNYLILLPLDTVTKYPIISMDAQYRNARPTKKSKMYLHDTYLRYSHQESTYTTVREQFLEKWKYSRMDKLGPASREHDISFQSNILEESLQYVFDVWTNKDMIKNEVYHDFYFKFVYYYNIIGVIIWASDIPSDTNYSKYITKDTFKINVDKTDHPDNYRTDRVRDIMQKSALETMEGFPGHMNAHYTVIINKSIKLFSGTKRISKLTRVPADMLPVGHFLNKIPRLYLPDIGWKTYPSYLKLLTSDDRPENDIVIGYDSFDKSAMKFAFKLRDPVASVDIENNDKRMLYKGSQCFTKSKSYLLTIAKKLDVTIVPRSNMRSICESIKKQLILNETTKKNNLRWFYYYYENQPMPGLD